MEIVVLKPTTITSHRALRPHRELLIAWTLLLLEHGALHGYRLHHELATRGLDLQATGLYRWLGKFERDRWVASRWSDSVEGPRRHVYRPTAKGRAVLHDLSGVIATIADTYGTFLDAHEQALAQRAGGDADRAPARRDRSMPAPVAAAGSAKSRPLRPHKELLVGWLLLHLDAGPTYGYDLRREIDAHGLSIDPTVMYRMLRRLEADKWVQSRWMAPAAGPRRRFYRLTTRGRRNLDEIARLLAAIRDLHDAYLREYEDAGFARDAGAIAGDPSPPA